MSASPNQNSDDKPTPPDKSTVVLLLGVAGDTTWRMFIPIVGLAVAGVWADRTYGTKPFLTITGIVVGVVIAAYLVRLQFKKELPKS